MKKKFLVTISNDYANLKGVEFLCSFFLKESEHQITLFHICRTDASDMNKALMEMWVSPDEDASNTMTVGAKKALNISKKALSSSKMSIDRIVTKTVAERYGKVRDILAEGEKGLYDAIILGRRAAYALQWIIERPADEIAQSMIKENSLTTPLWICPEPDTTRENVLVCVDGSENGYRAVDHVGYILSKQLQHRITLFHVKKGTLDESQEIFERATTILSEHNISSDRIDYQTTWAVSVVSAILKMAENNGYAAIALGLHGNEKTGILKEFNLAGGVTSALIAKIENVSLWCVP